MRKNKKVVRLSENQLHSIIAESVNKILMEMDSDYYFRKGREAYRNDDEDLENQTEKQLEAEHPANNPLYKNTFRGIGNRVKNYKINNLKNKEFPAYQEKEAAFINGSTGNKSTSKYGDRMSNYNHFNQFKGY